MSRKNKLTEAQRINAVIEYEGGEGTYESIAKKYGLHRSTLHALVKRAESEGIETLRLGRRNKTYSKETKLEAVTDYLTGKGSQSKICAKYKITQKSLLQQWIKWYNSGNDFKERNRSERAITMKKGRKTTQSA